ncbi:HEAT repeat-containing protein [Saccharicrinis carchari]|uniref:HEAT repeat-containing protein n=2 Tax=Saccharicrinis carchari TaxID=1168039 RepID=A0A521DC11_SACCC|nr:HEAT repeat-containing protein [Saccharicrinis carchari]
MRVEELIQVFGTENGKDREKAREALVKIGKGAIASLLALLEHPKYIYRWEAMMTLKDVEDESLVPVFIEKLTDKEHDIRWIAAEGLIRQGAKSIKPLLYLLIEKSESVFVVAGAHHVFYVLKKNNQLPKGFLYDDIMPLLENTRHTEQLKVAGYKLLHEIGAS